MRAEFVIFDLDDTLYPAGKGLMQAISARITAYLVTHLGMTPEEANALRLDYYNRYGSSVRPLVQNHALDLADFLRYAHDVDVEKQLAPDEDLQCLLDCVHSHKVIFSNAPRAYAKRVLERLGVAHQFARVFDYEFSEYVGKPNAALYDQVQAVLGVPSEALVMVDDALKNLAPAHTLGWKTVWVNPRGAESSPLADFIVGDLWQVAIAFRQLGLLDARHHVMAEHRLAGCAWAQRA